MHNSLPFFVLYSFYRNILKLPRHLIHCVSMLCTLHCAVLTFRPPFFSPSPFLSPPLPPCYFVPIGLYFHLNKQAQVLKAPFRPVGFLRIMQKNKPGSPQNCSNQSSYICRTFQLTGWELPAELPGFLCK